VSYDLRVVKLFGQYMYTDNTVRTGTFISTRRRAA